VGIFDRLSRMVRSEVRDLGKWRRVEAEAPEAPEEPAEDQPVAGPTPGGPAERWPKQIRLAYAALELPLGADLEAVRSAYRRLLQRYHPDKHQSRPDRLATANELTSRLNEARDTLEAFLTKPRAT
jgi:DnaJ-domain-containing protein 1